MLRWSSTPIECLLAFNTLKEMLVSAPIIIALDWDLPFEFMCDASMLLEQFWDNRMITCACHLLYKSNSNRRASAIEHKADWVMMILNFDMQAEGEKRLILLTVDVRIKPLVDSPIYNMGLDASKNVRCCA